MYECNESNLRFSYDQNEGVAAEGVSAEGVAAEGVAAEGVLWSSLLLFDHP